MWQVAEGSLWPTSHGDSVVPGAAREPEEDPPPVKALDEAAAQGQLRATS